MTPEERELLKETAELARDNNKILRGIRRGARFNSFLRVIYWLIILGGAIWTWNFIAPYLAIMAKGYNDVQKGIQSVNTATDKINNSLPDFGSFFGDKNN
jgi:hypothetical protein